MRPEQQYNERQTPISTKPCLSYWGLYKSSKILRYLTSYYFPLYGLGFKEFLDCYPVLATIEGLVYEADEELEARQAGQLPFAGEAPWNDRRAIIIDLLESMGLIHPAVIDGLDNLSEYYRLENKLVYHGVVTHENAIQMIENQCGDIRTLHSVLVQMTNKPYDEKIFSAIWPMEVWETIQIDLIHYAHDVAARHNNIYRFFVKLYGKEAPEYLAKEQEHYRELIRARLAQLPSDIQNILLGNARKTQKTPIPDPIFED